MTSDATGLGASDADSRWIGIRRHQALLVVAGLLLAGDGVLRSSASPVEIAVGLALMAAAVPLGDGLTIGALAAVAASYATRPRWSGVRVEAGERGVDIEARGRVEVAGYALVHVGRLDLAGLDRDHATTLARHVDALAAAGGDAHVSVHVRTSREASATVASVTGGGALPALWRRDDECIVRAVDLPGRRASLLERWSYVRVGDGVRAVLRVSDLTTADPGTAVLARVQLSSDLVTVAVHLAVVAAGRGRRLAERAVHRYRSDGATTTAAGFRRTAHLDQTVARAVQRESDVAAGRALVRLAVFVTVRAESLSELRAEVRVVRRALHESGVRVERGRGRQAEWFCRQLPGGPGW